MRTHRDFANEVRKVMGLDPIADKPIKDLSEENAKLKKELRRMTEKESQVRQMYNYEVKKRSK